MGRSYASHGTCLRCGVRARRSQLTWHPDGLVCRSATICNVRRRILVAACGPDGYDLLRDADGYAPEVARTLTDAGLLELERRGRYRATRAGAQLVGDPES